MINSMTGFGRAQWQSESWRVSVEVRSVNQRGLKISFRGPDPCRSRESELETIIKGRISRGHVFCTITCDPSEGATEAYVDERRLAVYVKVADELAQRNPNIAPPSAAELMLLPDVVKRDPLDEESFEKIWPHVKETVAAAMDKMSEMREAEGRNLVREFHTICAQIDARVSQIAERAPLVVEEYRDRLVARAQQLLEGVNGTVTLEDLHREIAFFAERSDITEELARLRSHIQQFLESLESPEPVGRKLEFLTQEMFREANTTAAKGNDNAIVHTAVDIKTDIDRMREQVLNIE